MADDDITPAPAYEDERSAAAAAGPPPAARRKAGKAIAALILGIVSLIAPLGIVPGTIAVVLGVLARKEIAADTTLEGDGMALAGIITGAIGSLLFVVYVAVSAG